MTMDSQVEATQRVAADSAHRALFAGDRESLDQLVAQGRQIIGPKGFQIAKDDWIHAHVDDVYELESLSILQTDGREWADSAVITDREQSACIFHGERIEGLFRVLSVWHRDESKHWRLEALQYTAASEAVLAQGRASA